MSGDASARESHGTCNSPVRDLTEVAKWPSKACKMPHCSASQTCEHASQSVNKITTSPLDITADEAPPGWAGAGRRLTALAGVCGRSVRLTEALQWRRHTRRRLATSSTGGAAAQTGSAGARWYRHSQVFAAISLIQSDLGEKEIVARIARLIGVPGFQVRALECV